MWTWFVIIVALIVLPSLTRALILFVVLPIRLHQNQTLRLDPDYRETRLEDLTPEMRDFLSQALPELRAEGFEVAANVHVHEGVTKTSGSNVFLVNRQSRDVASVLLAQSRGRQASTLLVGSRFADGNSVITANNRILSPYPRDPHADGATFPWVTSAAALVEVHRRRLRALGRDGEERVCPEPGEEVGYLTRLWKQEGERFVRCGYKWNDPEQGVRRFTWRGAFLAGWKSVPAVARMRMSRRERRGRKLWNQLGMQEWSGSRPRAVPPPLPV